MTTPLSDDRKDHPAAGAVIIGVNLSTAVILRCAQDDSRA